MMRSLIALTIVVLVSLIIFTVAQHRAGSQSSEPSRQLMKESAAATAGPLASRGERELDDPLVQPVGLPADSRSNRHASSSRQTELALGATQPVLFAADFSSDQRAHFHPHGTESCASGCSASNHPTPMLSLDEFRGLISHFSTEPTDETSFALESLLYNGRQTITFLEQEASQQLDSRRLEFLRRELSRTHAIVSFRIVDERGVVRTELSPTRVPLDRRHVFEMQVTDLPPLITSGTVKRVGLHHLWTRL